jgi:colanic acid biosynthesis glycosyl transferase WcaI
MSHTRPPRLLVISQVYVPDAAAVGQYVADVCEEAAARGWDVIVYTSARGYDDPTQRYPAAEVRRGVRIQRLPLSSFGKRSIPIRLAAQLLFMLQASARALFAGRVTSLLVSTSPPFAGLFGALLSVVKRAPLTWWVMDLNPDQMIAAGKLTASSLVPRMFDWMNRVTILQATTIVVLDRYMKDRVVAKLPPRADVTDKVHVLPPWSLDTHLEPCPTATKDFRIRHGLEDVFVVMYAGNHSDQNPLDTLLAAADTLVDQSDIRFVFVGGGAGKVAVDTRVKKGSSNVLSLPYQPIESLAATLAAADLHVVTMGDSVVGIVHPCKIYSAMAVSRPILVFGPEHCHAADILADSGCGWHVRHGDVAAAVAAVTTAAALDTADCEAMGHKAAAMIAARFSRGNLIDRFLLMVEPSDTP